MLGTGPQLVLLSGLFGHKLANGCLSQTDGGSVNCSLPLWYLAMPMNVTEPEARLAGARIISLSLPSCAFSACLQVYVRTLGFVYLSLGVEKKITWAVDHSGSLVPPERSM